jgi:hypothetical protein
MKRKAEKCEHHGHKGCILERNTISRNCVLHVRFQVLTAASMKSRIVFWDVLPAVHPRRQFWTVYSMFECTFPFVFSPEARKDQHCSRRSSVSIVSDYRLDHRGSIPGRAKLFSSSLCVQTSSEAHAASCPMRAGSPFPAPGDKVRLGCDADHFPI